MLWFQVRVLVGPPFQSFHLHAVIKDTQAVQPRIIPMARPRNRTADDARELPHSLQLQSKLAPDFPEVNPFASDYGRFMATRVDGKVGRRRQGGNNIQPCDLF